jgi:ferredoxin
MLGYTRVTPGENGNYNRPGGPLRESLHKRLRLGSLEESLAYIICEPCIGTKDSACVDVCPVDCIHPRKDEPEFETAEMLYIHPDECIDCGACVPACPVEAIFALDETPEKWKNFIPVNAKYYDK